MVHQTTPRSLRCNLVPMKLHTWGTSDGVPRVNKYGYRRMLFRSTRSIRAAVRRADISGFRETCSILVSGPGKSTPYGAHNRAVTKFNANQLIPRIQVIPLAFLSFSLSLFLSAPAFVLLTHDVQVTVQFQPRQDGEKIANQTIRDCTAIHRQRLVLLSRVSTVPC